MVKHSCEKGLRYRSRLRFHTCFALDALVDGRSVTPAEAAMAPKKNAKSCPGMYSKGALAKKAADKAAHEESVRAALAFAQFHERGAKWAISNGDFLDGRPVAPMALTHTEGEQ